MNRQEIKEVVRAYLGDPNANDTKIAGALCMTKGNFSKYVDPLNVGHVKAVKAWCFDNYDLVEAHIPDSWVGKSSEGAA